MEEVSQMKYLGVLFHKKLLEKLYSVGYICSKLSIVSWALLKLPNYVPKTSAHQRCSGAGAGVKQIFPEPDWTRS